MVGDTLYFSTPYAAAVALDATTGHELWRFDSEAWRWPNPTRGEGFVHRGVAQWSGSEGRRIFLHSRWRLIALEAATGQPVQGFGEHGVVDLSVGLRWEVDRTELTGTSPPLVVGNVVIVGSSIADNRVYPRNPPGDVQAFDAQTGRRLWRWDPVPAAGDPAAATWKGTSRDSVGHLNVWAPMTADTSRGLVYLPVSTPSNDWYGGHRLGDGLYGESLVCLEAATGRLVWYRQLVHHGLWDYDPAAPPNLVTVNRNGELLDLVTLPGKTGFLYVFDRVTGAPVWPIEERPVLPSDVPGEEASPTQPFPVWPAPFAQQGFGPDDLVDFTPELRQRASEHLASYRLGPLFTPPSEAGAVVMPGWLGGAGWGGGAVDPVAGVIYIKATNRPSLGRLVPAMIGGRAGFTLDFGRAPGALLDLSVPDGRSWWPPFTRRFLSVPINKPPYGTLTAIDLATGAQLWQVPVGDDAPLRRRLEARGIQTGPLGSPGPPGGVVTAGGLVFITGNSDHLYALDTRDGRVLWSAALEQAARSNPMTYRTAAGMQVVVVAAGEGGRSTLRAFALPK